MLLQFMMQGQAEAPGSTTLTVGWTALGSGRLQ